MLVTIDRFEGDFAVVELPDMTFLDVPKELFPNAKEGDIFKIEKDESEKQLIEDRIKQLTDELFQ